MIHVTNTANDRGTYNEVLQFFVILALLIPLTVAGLARVGGWDGLQQKIIAAGNGGELHAWPGTPLAEIGSSAASPRSLNVWITSRMVSSSAATNLAIAATGVPELEAMMIVARRTRIELPRPRRTI